MTYPLAVAGSPATRLVTELAAKKAEAAAKWAHFQDVRSMSKGTDLTKDTVAFGILDAAGRAYDEAAEEVKTLEAKVGVERQDQRQEAAGGGYDPHRWSKAVAADPGSFDFKSLTASGWTLPPVLDPTVLMKAANAFFLRQIIPQALLDGTDRYSYIRQSARTNNAAAVAAAAPKPTSTPEVERIEGTVSVIAHLSEALDRSMVMDTPSLMEFLDVEMRLGILLEEDDQILNGNGTPPNQRGILETTGTLTQALGTDSRTDAIAKAINQVRLEEMYPDAVVLHPSDWLDIALEKDASGNYLHGPDSPVNAPAKSVWGLPVLTSTALAVGTGLVGWFAGGARLYIREQTRVDVTDSHDDLFSKNQLLVRVEERIGIAVPRPKAFCELTDL